MNKPDLLNFDKVIEFQQIFDTTSSEPNFDGAELRVSLIQEELNELEQAFVSKDLSEVLDAYNDILFLTIGGLVKNGLIQHFVESFNDVCDSNLSKADLTICDALKTKHKYDILNIETYFEERNGKYITMRKSDDKILKSYIYNKVELSKYFK